MIEIQTDNSSTPVALVKSDVKLTGSYECVISYRPHRSPLETINRWPDVIELKCGDFYAGTTVTLGIPLKGFYSKYFQQAPYSGVLLKFVSREYKYQTFFNSNNTKRYEWTGNKVS